MTTIDAIIQDSKFVGYVYHNPGVKQYIYLNKSISMNNIRIPYPEQFGYSTIPAAPLIYNIKISNINNIKADYITEGKVTYVHGTYELTKNDNNTPYLTAKYEYGIITKLVVRYDNFQAVLEYDKLGYVTNVDIIDDNSKLGLAMGCHAVITAAKDTSFAPLKAVLISTQSIESNLSTRSNTFSINNRRDLIKEKLLTMKEFKGRITLTDKHLQILFDTFDKFLFSSSISQYLSKNNTKLSFNVSNKMSKTAGVCKKRIDKTECSYTITLSSILNDLFTNDVKSLKINGVIITNQLDGILSVFEHELLHLIINLFCPPEKIVTSTGKAHRDIHGKTFKDLAFGLFGHTETKHGILQGDVETYQAKVQEIKTAIDTKKKELGKGMIVTINDPKFPGKWLVIGNIRSNSKRVQLQSVTDPSKKWLIPINMIVL